MPRPLGACSHWGLCLRCTWGSRRSDHPSSAAQVWGVWSSPLYVRTVEPIQVALDLVGEEYAHVSWQRLPMVLPEDRISADMVVMVSAGNRQYKNASDQGPDGNLLFCGDPTGLPPPPCAPSASLRLSRRGGEGP